MHSISVIIPTFNEQETIQNCLNQVSLVPFQEIIIADSSTPQIKPTNLPPNTRVITAPKGRAIQMNAAAGLATSDIFLFLHADTFLPHDAAHFIRSAIEKGNVAGCFNRTFTPNNKILNVTSKLAYLRAKHLFWAYGDQAIFITKNAFQQLGGYPQLTHFEDLELCILSKQIGKHTIIAAPIQTSSRRFKNGTLRTLVTDLAATIKYLAFRK